jgi:putative colanic acid biosynthesis UDP-glucose lipid carrier transferase
MSNNILGRYSIAGAILALLRAFVPSAVTVLVLYLVVCHVAGEQFSGQYIALSTFAFVLGLIVLRPSETSGEQFEPNRISILTSTIARWVAFLATLLLIGFLTKTSAMYSRQVILIWALVTPAGLVLAGLLLHRYGDHLHSSGLSGRKAVFAGCNDVSTALAARLTRSREFRIQTLGFFDDRSSDRLCLAPDTQLLGRLPELAEYVKANGVDVIFIALPMRHLPRVVDLLDDLRDTTASIYYVPDIFVYDLIQARTADLAGMPVIAMCETPFYGYRGIVKRLMDVSIAGTALVALLPVLLIVALLVLLTSPGPVIFRQTRYGLDGGQITVYKFRSMTVMEDGSDVVQARRNDSRMTTIGALLRRTSLDELPQLVNVLQGRMSLVGPRPHAVAHNEQYRRLIKGYMIRHKVKPGITGLAQVNGCRGETTQLEEMQARVQYDLDYLRGWSVGLDLLILWRTFLLLFRREDRAY